MAPLASSTVTASYQDENGQPLAEDIVQAGKLGEPYHTKAWLIPGYELVGTKGHADGVFSAQKSNGHLHL
ncbi:MucBP domain-containing protein [Listeria costaricensis]|uniref:MucBP domain-containing protein n=1 Tax=Listeria costaricensis TaxID=2026604 RepID=UPI000C07216B